MLKRILAALAGAVLIAVGLAGPTTAESRTVPVAVAVVAAADIDGLEFGLIGYNAYGNDRPWNRNQEFVDIRNGGAEPVNVKGLRVEDAWAHGRGDGAGRCNNFTVTSLPGVVEDGGRLLLAPGRTVRVYVGSGTPAVFNDTFHAVYMNHDVRCGYHGHFLNNTAQKDRGAPWDTVWITLSSATESKSYNFSSGYVAR